MDPSQISQTIDSQPVGRGLKWRCCKWAAKMGGHIKLKINCVLNVKTQSCFQRILKIFRYLCIKNGLLGIGGGTQKVLRLKLDPQLSWSKPWSINSRSMPYSIERGSIQEHKQPLTHVTYESGSDGLSVSFLMSSNKNCLVTDPKSILGSTLKLQLC